MNKYNLYNEICSYDNLELAFRKARKRKTMKYYVIDFEKNLKENLLNLQNELRFYYYKPKPLETFIIRDPKTRKISKSDFRDRVVHHAIINILEPIYEKTLIYDSYANRKNKGTHRAIKRFDYFKRKVSKNNIRKCYVLKIDIKRYFHKINHEILIKILRRKIKCEKTIWLIKQILDNYEEANVRIGIPLGNLTSQFFANVYLNELDYFVKHKLRIRYYVRYVDDFVILHEEKEQLEIWKEQINNF
jgi:retron-type reverse transcriptase